ncbi:MAG: zinc-ribbon and DUF3426 domain-containing protein [Burkholderiaceae bacterium]
MSLATRCPSCGTIFRVVQDQLKVSEGWVRCGQCHEVFHGIEALFDLGNDPAVAARRAARDGMGSAPAPAPPSEAPTASAPPPAPPPWQVPGPPAPAPAFPDVAANASRTFVEQGHAAPMPMARQPDLSPPRSTIAPRFAAKLAEQSARMQAAAPPSPIPSAFVDDTSPSGLQDSGLPGNAEPSWLPTEPASMSMPFMASASIPEPPPAAWIRESPPSASSTLSPAEVEAPPAAPAPAPGARADDPAANAADAPARAPRATPHEPWAPARDDGDAGESTLPSLLAGDDEDDRAGPPTLASMLPEDAGDWPPRRNRHRSQRLRTNAPAGARIRSDDPRFLREAKRGMRWRRPWVRAGLGVASAILVVVAAAQLAWPQREALAARWPATLPLWAWLCDQAGCTIEPPRALASLALDGSSLTRTETDHVLLFSADLHNRADHEVRMPSFDLTFMDLNGEIVARKVLSPAQIGIRQKALAPEAELHVHARIRVGKADANGFQAEMFYP